MYRHFTRVDTDKIPFRGEAVFYHTLKGLGDAALRMAMTHRFTTTRTKHGKRPIRPPKLECAEDIINLLTLPDGTTLPATPLAFTPAFQTALDNAKAAAYPPAPPAQG